MTSLGTGAVEWREMQIAAQVIRRQQMLAEVREGLSRAQKELPPKYFYDQRGSELFERITALPEYYLTRAERTILRAEVPSLVEELRPRALVELGAGSASKTRFILDAMNGEGSLDHYVPIDVSAEFLADTAKRLQSDYRELRIVPAVADIERTLGLPAVIPRPALFAFLGSTIGNFRTRDALRLLRRIRTAMGPFDRLLLGVDLRKAPETIERAYNDSAGVTAEFNRNMLRVLNRELGANFRVEQYLHRAFYAAAQHQVEMHLVAAAPQVIDIPGVGIVSLGARETIRTEISCKYDRPTVDRMFDSSGLLVDRWMTDDESRFALVLGTPRP